MLENIAARRIQDRAVPLGPALQLSISDKLCGLPAKGCAEPCQPGHGRLAPGWGGGESPQGSAEGQPRSPGSQPSGAGGEGAAAWTQRAFYRQELARCEPTSDREVLHWCASVLGGEKRTGCLWARPTSVGCLPPTRQREKSPHRPLLCRQAGAKQAGVPQSRLGCPRGQNQPGGDIRAVPSSDAVIAQYGLGAALSCDALTQMEACSWKGDVWSLLHVRWGCTGRDRGVSHPGGGSWLDKECFKRGWCS